jgi:hypothetical protein
MQQSLGCAPRYDPSEPADVARANHDDADVLLFGELLKSASGRRVRCEWSQLDVVDVVECASESGERASRVLAQDNPVGLLAWAKRLRPVGHSQDHRSSGGEGERTPERDRVL